MQTVDGRIVPELPPQAFKTYRISAPLATHWNTVTCADAGCPHYLGGWESHIDERTGLGRRQAHYIRSESGRRFTEHRNELGLTVFAFEAGQKCFASHKARNMRPEHYLERGGDWRAAVGRPVEHTKPDFWVESFALNQDRLKTITDRG
jgi:hypothetical protein